MAIFKGEYALRLPMTGSKPMLQTTQRFGG